VKFEAVTEAVRGVPVMSIPQGRAIYDHIIETRPENVLELGTAHGVSASYMAAALDENGAGAITTLDRTEADYVPVPADVLARSGLERYVSVVRTPDSSYDWFLKKQIEAQSTSDGHCEPLYDLCYLDGAHEWTIDGLAVLLVEKLLRPGGWIVLDDLTWTYASRGLAGADMNLSEEERQEPHMKAIFDLLISQHPSFTELRIDADLDWAWARKAPGEPKRLRIETRQSLAGAVLMRLRRVMRARQGAGR
jgi:predicted O-methyltransferase YrrM